jgi:hypothetical protein
MNKDFESARQKYKPEVIKFLLIAEAPPRVEAKRFFYFEDVQKHDSLFWETMKVLYLGDCSVTKSLRRRKREFLEKFRNDGFYLLDATDTPMEDRRPAKKRERIEESLPSLIEKVRNVGSEDTKIILISSAVYNVCYSCLKSEGFNVINESMIDFPGPGRQKEFRKKLSALLQRHGWEVMVT